MGTNSEKRTFHVTNFVIQNIIFSSRGDVSKRLIVYNAPQEDARARQTQVAVLHCFPHFLHPSFVPPLLRLWYRSTGRGICKGSSNESAFSLLRFRTIPSSLTWETKEKSSTVQRQFNEQKSRQSLGRDGYTIHSCAILQREHRRDGG